MSYAKTFPLFLALALCGCAAPEASGSSAPAPTPGATGSGPSTDEAAACRAKGGSMIRVGMRQQQACAIPYRDAGKACHDDADCIGICKTQGAPPPGQRAAGTCQRHDQDRFGCYAEIRDGKATPVLCVD